MTSLLDDIIDKTVDDTVRLPIVLRMCLVLAANLKNNRLKSWALSELNGYNSNNNLPSYRIVGIHAKGDFTGPLGSELYGFTIPAQIIDEKFRFWATTAYLTQGIVTYEETSRANFENGSARIEWPGDLVILYQTKILTDKDYVLNRAWQEIPLGCIRVLVDSVRNKLLEFALELKEDDNVSLKSLTQERVDQAVTNIIFGSGNVIGNSAGGDVSQDVGTNVNQNDVTSLAAIVRAFELPDSEVETLQNAILEDRKGGESSGFGKRTLDWIGQAVAHIGSVGTATAGEAAKPILIKMIKDYLGQP